jgi:hypothetical protein
VAGNILFNITANVRSIRTIFVLYYYVSSYMNGFLQPLIINSDIIKVAFNYTVKGGQFNYEL